MWVEDFVTVVLSVFWLLWIGFLFLKARGIRRELREQEEILRRSYQKAPEEAYLEPLAYLQASGWKASDALSRHDMISRWRASAQSARQRVAAYIEMMPQIGLLGTVVSLLLAALFFDFDTRTLGFALNTTIMGLIGALFGRWWIENPAEESFYNVLELLQNREVVSRLVHVITRPHATDEDADPVPLISAVSPKPPSKVTSAVSPKPSVETTPAVSPKPSSETTSSVSSKPSSETTPAVSPDASSGSRG